MKLVARPLPSPPSDSADHDILTIPVESLEGESQGDRAALRDQGLARDSAIGRQADECQGGGFLGISEMEIYGNPEIRKSEASQDDLLRSHPYNII